MKARSKAAILAVTLTLSTSVSANPLKDLFDKFFSINKEEKTECQKMSNDEVAALCVEEVCGSASQTPVIVNRETVEQYNSADTLKKMDEIEKTLETRKETFDRYIEFVEAEQEKLKNLDDPSKINDDETNDLLGYISDLIREEHSFLNKFAPNDFVKNDKLKLIVPFTSPYSKIYKDVLSKINISENFDFAMAAGIPPKLEDVQKDYAQKVKLFEQELQKKNLKSDISHSSIKSKDLGESMMARSELLAKAKEHGINLEKPACDNDCKKSLVTFIKSKKFFDPRLVQEKEESLFNHEDSIAECRSTIAFSNVEAKDSQIIQEEWPKLIERFKNNTSLNLSDHSKAILLEKIQTSLNVRFNIKSPLRNPLFDNTSMMEERMKTRTLRELYSLSTQEKDFQAHAKIPRCNSANEVAIISDHVLFKPAENKGDLAVSPFSCEHHHIGKEVMAHELGHAISYFISFTPDMSVETKEGFQKLRKCSGAEKGTAWFPSLFAIHQDDKWTTEEDTADLFSFALSEDTENFMGCALALPNGEKYVGLDMKRNFFDTHSSGIQRLMVELQYKNPSKITEACEEVIKRSKAKITKKCY